jgi:DNA-binding response OmpR family regulator
LLVTYQGRSLDLTPTEFEILASLIQVQGALVTFEEIVLRAQGLSVERDEARVMLSTHMSNLRAKLRLAGCEQYLKNRRGVGYFIGFDPA